MTGNDRAVAAGDIAYERRGALGLIRLTRPRALNAVTHDMVLSLTRRLTDWAADDGVASVAIVGEGRSFSAGGDIRAIYEWGMTGRPFDRFFADEYALNITIKRFPKPYVALMDGLAMGGGVGVSYHGSHRVVGERARFAMPECGIGFFPDVGGTYLLSRLPGALGLYLGLSGHRLGPAEQLACGLATHYAPVDAHDAILDRLADGEDADGAVGTLACPGKAEFPEGAFTAFDAEPYAALHGFMSAHDHPSGDLHGTLATKSPTSLGVTAFLIPMAATRSFERCMGLEARIAYRMLRRDDFYEGIRAAVIEKDGEPQWSPASLDALEDEVIDDHFAQVHDGPLAAISALE